MNDIICRSHFWHAKFSGEELYCVWDPFWSCFWDLCLMAYVVLHGWTDVPSGFSMWFPLCPIFWGLLLLYLMGIVVCGFNQTIHRYVCNLIGGDEVLISREGSYLLLLAVVICPTIGDGSLHLHCIVLLWSGYGIYVFLSMNCWTCDYFGWLTGNWYTWLSWPFLPLSILCCPWYGTLGWFRGFLIMLSMIWKHV